MPFGTPETFLPLSQACEYHDRRRAVGSFVRVGRTDSVTQEVSYRVMQEILVHVDIYARYGLCYASPAVFSHQDGVSVQS